MEGGWDSETETNPWYSTIYHHHNLREGESATMTNIFTTLANRADRYPKSWPIQQTGLLANHRTSKQQPKLLVA